MFTTFVGVSPRESGQRSVPAPRPKRSQVHRACDWCRLNRVKCDNSRPCNNCKQLDRRCSNDGLNEFRSLASATKEVERLRAQIRDLEKRLKARTGDISPTPSLTPDKPRLPQEDMIEYYEGKTRIWEGIYVADETQTHTTQYYGPSSTTFFLRRMSSFLSSAVDQPNMEITPYNTTAILGIPITGLRALSLEDHLNCDYLLRLQQDYFLDLFWHGSHAIYPIIDEAEFRQHYESLWPSSPMSDGTRKPSPLVDIVLALCIQFGSTFIPRDSNQTIRPEEEEDVRLAGKAYYQRCHAFLSETMETPSLTTLQCYVFSIVYLMNAGLLNSAQQIVATSIRIAYMLGINHEPPDDLPEPQKELSRRIWWTIYILDSQMCMELGRPSLTQLSQSTCRLPNDSLEVAQSLGPNYVSPSPDITWLTFQTQTLLLVNSVRTIHEAFYEKCNEAVSQLQPGDFYRDGQARERCARFLADCMKKLNAWVQQVPVGCRMPRKSNGEAFSTDRSQLDLNPGLPLWLQCQRLLLELHYHHHAMNLYRAFICFSPTPATFTPLSDNNAISCLNHAMAITNIVNQVLTETDILNGLYRVYQWQKNAMFSIVGFACGYPICPSNPSARRAIATAISNLDIISNNFAAAGITANLTRELSARADYVIDRFRSGLSRSRQPSLARSDQQSLLSFSEPTSNPSRIHSPTATGMDMTASDTVTSGADLESLWMTVEPAGSAELWATFNHNFDFSGSDSAN